MSIFHFMFDHDGDGKLNFWEASECDMWINQRFFSDDDNNDTNHTCSFADSYASSYDMPSEAAADTDSKYSLYQKDKYDNYYTGDYLVEFHGYNEYDLKEFCGEDNEDIYPFYFEDFHPEFRSRMLRRKYDADYPEGCGVYVDRNNPSYQKLIAMGYYDKMLHISGFFDMSDTEKENFYNKQCDIKVEIKTEKD